MHGAFLLKEDAMNITTSITNTSLKSSDKGLVIDFINLVVNFVEPDNYFGGQIRLTAEEDGISFQTTTEDLASETD